MSKSNKPTLKSKSLKESAKLTETVDLPTPPLPLDTAKICFIPDIVEGPC